MKKSLQRIAALTQRNIKEILRDPLSLIFAIGMPLAMELLFYLIFHGLTDQFLMKYLAPGIVVFAQAFLCLFIGLLLSADRNTSFLTRLFVSKAKSYEFIFSYALAVLPVVLAQSILFFIVGGIFDASLFNTGMMLAIVLSIVTALFFIAAGILIGSLCGEKSIGGVSSIIIVGQSVLSGMWFPIEGLSGTITTIMNVLPFRNATLLIQNALNGTTDAFGGIYLPLIIVLAYAVATFIIAITVFRLKMKAD